MSSRQQEKERRKAEREAAEAAAARSASRKGRLQLALGGLLAIAAIAVAVLVIGQSGSDDASGGSRDPQSSVELPAQRETNLQAAAEAASCTLRTYPSEGDQHTTDESKWVYKTNPPTSGPHAPPPAADDGLYEPGNSPTVGKHVHSLEHGRIDIQYKPGTDPATIERLETLGSEPLQFGTEGYHVLVFENNTEMEAAVAATAWTHSLTCAEMNDGVYDAIRAFRTEYTDKGPELIP